MIAKLILVVITLAAFQTAMAQTTKEADPADVASLDSIMKAVYDVISGDAGKTRDWDRFRSLFYDGARLIPTGKDAKTGVVTAHVLSPDDYVKRVEPFFAKQGFYERETARRVETYGAVTHVFSTYESRHNPSDKTPFARGINSFQLFNDGKRCWVITIYWQAETPELPIPTKYLTSGN